MAFLIFSFRASGVSIRYTPVVLAPAMKMRVHACAILKFAPMNAVAKRKPVIIVNMRVCPLTPGDIRRRIELGSQNRDFCSGKVKALLSLSYVDNDSKTLGLMISTIPVHVTVRN